MERGFRPITTHTLQFVIAATHDYGKVMTHQGELGGVPRLLEITLVSALEGACRNAAPMHSMLGFA